MINGLLEAGRRPIPIPRSREHRDPKEGPSHRARYEEGCPHAVEVALDETHARSPPSAPSLSRGQEDRPTPLPRAIPEGQGQRFQEQACTG